jgi:hypothetical protein
VERDNQGNRLRREEKDAYDQYSCERNQMASAAQYLQTISCDLGEVALVAVSKFIEFCHKPKAVKSGG